jgi:hypothetical protein
MSTQTSSEYLLLFRGTDWNQNLSSEELHRIMEKWNAWFDRLAEQGKIIGAEPLEPDGKIVSGKNGQKVSDGPFAESKEAIGGYFRLHVNNPDEALQIAKECPILEYGLTVEVRPVANMCPTFRSIVEPLAHAKV